VPCDKVLHIHRKCSLTSAQVDLVGRWRRAGTIPTLTPSFGHSNEAHKLHLWPHTAPFKAVPNRARWQASHTRFCLQLFENEGYKFFRVQKASSVEVWGHPPLPQPRISSQDPPRSGVLFSAYLVECSSFCGVDPAPA
jgi:hypothetical protein